MLNNRNTSSVSKRKWLARAVSVAAGCVLSVSPLMAFSKSDDSLHDRLPQALKDRGYITAVGDSYPPYRIVGGSGRISEGVETDLLKALEPMLGVEIRQALVAQLSSLLAGLSTGRYDLSTGPLRTTAERESRYDLIVWKNVELGFLYLNDGNPRMNTFQDLCGKTVAVATGASTEHFVETMSKRCEERNEKPIRKVGLPNQNSIVLAVQSGRADAAALQSSAGYYVQKQNPGHFRMVTDTKEDLGVSELGFVLDKDSALTPVLLEALQQLWASGQYDEIMAKWGLENSRLPEPKLNPSSSK